jgi:hypothetical protein
VSRLNKVNKDRYTMAGRLTPDELAAERLSQKHLKVDPPRRAKPAATGDKSTRAKRR